MPCKCNNLLEEYQAWTKTTAIYPADVEEEYLMAGLVGEAGEVAGKYAKFIRDFDPTPCTNAEVVQYNTYTDSILKELSDIMWFVSQICNMYEFTMEDVLLMNMAKLESRKERGVLGGSGDDR